jgi:hypothetical protein
LEGESKSEDPGPVDKKKALVVTRKQKYSENGNRGTAKSGTRIQ